MPERKAKEEIEIFHTYLRQNGLKKTYQKDLILETFIGTEGHLCVEDVYAIVKKRDRRIGIVTVFRTLKSLTACGLAREITLGDGLTRFEHNYRHPYHHHIICTDCGRAIEFLSPELEALQKEIVQRYGFKAVHHRFLIYGTCRECSEDRPVADKPHHDTERIFARDAVRMALCVEKLGLEFYREAAARNVDPRGKETLERIAGEEAFHFSRLETELGEIHQKEAGLEIAPMFLHFDPYQLQQMIPDLREYETPDGLRLSVRQSLEIAMLLEKRAADFFRSYAERFADTEGKRVLQRFSEEESRHCSQINRWMEEALLAAS